MDARQQSLQELQQIKKMMERSSKFISLSGLSGIAAGTCALIGAWLASGKINCWMHGHCSFGKLAKESPASLQSDLFLIALFTFIGAFVTAFLFTYLRSKRTRVPLWGTTAYRLFWNMCIPRVALFSTDLHW